MSLVLGAAVSYSPLLYRPRVDWPRVWSMLTQGVTQPQAREGESDALLAEYERRVNNGLDTLAKVVDAGSLDALIVMYADRDDMFDESNVPQLHLHTGGEAWADPAIRALGETSPTLRFGCGHDAAEFLGEELVRRGFDLSEGREEFKPVGRRGRGIGPAVGEAVARLGAGRPIVPLHINCHAEPMLSGSRLLEFGAALGEAAALSEHRLGLLISGGLSGDPQGSMAGWIDDVLDEWVLTRIVRGQAVDIAEIWGTRSRTLVGNSAEIRLWQVAAIALARAGLTARLVDYMPIHHAATGVGFVTWEPAA